MTQLFMILTFALISCQVKEDANVLLQPIDIMTPQPFTFLALGDSYTIGESVTEADRWPNQFVKLMLEEEIKFDAPKIIARTGWTTDELMQAIENEQIKDTFDLVSLLIGVNNQYRGRPAEQFRPELVQLLEKAIYFSGNDTSRVVVLSIPDWGVTPFANGRDRQKIAREIDAYNLVIQQECAHRNILFVDITPISREAATDLSLIAADGLHPSEKMYTLWVNEVVPQLLTKLEAK